MIEPASSDTGAGFNCGPLSLGISISVTKPASSTVTVFSSLNKAEQTRRKSHHMHKI